MHPGNPRIIDTNHLPLWQDLLCPNLPTYTSLHQSVRLDAEYGQTRRGGAVVGASQPHVSRVLQGNLSRATKLSEETCLYAERIEDGGVTLEVVRSNDDLMEVLRVTWDGSSARARAPASVIRSLAVLKR